MKLPSLSLTVFWFLTCCALPTSTLAAEKQRVSCLDPNSPDKTISRCTEIINRGDKELASNRAAACKHRGDAYLFNGKFDDAIADFSEAIRLSRDADAYTSRATAYYEKGDVDRAKADWAQAKRLKDSNKPRQ
jgi:tetratricopeptide (TPR) repeat protein